jgi:hypothetical protein
MITYLDISLFESPAQTLVNTVNTVGAMGKDMLVVSLTNLVICRQSSVVREIESG